MTKGTKADTEKMIAIGKAFGEKPGKRSWVDSCGFSGKSWVEDALIQHMEDNTGKPE